MSPSQQLRVGLRRRRGYLFRWFLEIFGAIWLVIETSSFFSAWVRSFTEGNYWLLLVSVAVAACGAVWRARVPVEVAVPLRTTNTEICVKFGDLFGQQAEHLAIPVNNGFDGELGVAVDPKSVHGQFIQKFYNGSGKEFEAACDALLTRLTSWRS